jgi:hypothetical protein
MIAHDVAALVHLLIEMRSPTAKGAAPSAGGDFVALLRDHRGDPTAPQHAPGDSAGVGPVGKYSIGSSARSPGAPPGNADLIEHRNQHRAIIALPTCHDDSQRSPASIDGSVDLGSHPAPGPSDAVTCRFAVSKRELLVI